MKYLTILLVLIGGFLLFSLNQRNNESQVVDIIAPVIVEDELTLEVLSEGVNFLSLIHATDNNDPNPVLSIDSNDVDLSLIGDYFIKLTAKDNSGNLSTKRVRVKVVDTTSPDITGIENFTIEVNTSEPDYLENVLAIDLYDGKLEVIVNSSSVNLSKVGSYTITF